MIEKDPKQFLTPKEVAEEVGCSRRYIDQCITEGLIKVFRPSNRIVRIRRSEMERWVEEFSSGNINPPSPAP